MPHTETPLAFLFYLLGDCFKYCFRIQDDHTEWSTQKKSKTFFIAENFYFKKHFQKYFEIFLDFFLKKILIENFLTKNVDQKFSTKKFDQTFFNISTKFPPKFREFFRKFSEISREKSGNFRFFLIFSKLKISMVKKYFLFVFFFLWLDLGILYATILSKTTHKHTKQER